MLANSSIVLFLFLLFQRRLSYSIATNDELNNCNLHLYEYAFSVAELVHCSAINARPFTLCENCVKSYVNATVTYATMINAVDTDGTPCRDVIINSDRVQVARRLNSAMSSIWDQSRCNNCFGGTIDDTVYPLSNSTLAFDQLVNDTFDCIEKYTNETVLGMELSQEEIFTNATVCSKCAPNYVDLNKLYMQMDTSSNGQLCMDTVDKMNLTRTIWSNRLQCVHYHNTAWAVILSTVVIGFMPIAFYVAVYLQADRQEHCVIPQKRLVSRQGAAVSLP